MKLLVKRKKQVNESTLGELYINGTYYCRTLEDRVRDLGPNGEGKVFGATAIPAGIYKIILNMSQRFQKILPRLLDVPFFTGILIHKGNTAEDTHGCILVGLEEHGDRITKSTEAWTLVWPRLQEASFKGEEIEIEIVNDFKIGSESQA